jgi:nitric oxide reductase subunit B
VVGVPLSDGAANASVALRRVAAAAAVALVLALGAGALASLHYLRPAGWLAGWERTFVPLRALHTTFASVWMFLGGIAAVHWYLEGRPWGATRFDRGLLRAHVLVWLCAGAATLVTLSAGIVSGREYVDFHPAISVPILVGWLLFLQRLLRWTWTGFLDQPIYVTMWGTSAVFFILTFAEAHAWLLDGVFERPVVDMRVQWKTCGTLVGSFNLLVYGCASYLGERLTGDPRVARSRLTYALFGVGLLNTFTNYVHHTYHLPQAALVKWISFVVSMAEAVLLAKVLWDLAGAVRRARDQRPYSPAAWLLGASRWWTAGMLAGAIVISIPPVNGWIHGTHVVMAHAMGAEIGIDTVILLAGLFHVLEDPARPWRQTRWIPLALWGFNASAAVLVLCLVGMGLGAGPRSSLVPVFVAAGALTAAFGLALAAVLLRRAVALWWTAPRAPAELAAVSRAA